MRKNFKLARFYKAENKKKTFFKDKMEGNLLPQQNLYFISIVLDVPTSEIAKKLRSKVELYNFLITNF